MWKLLLPRTWQKKISGTSKGARFTFECCRHSYSNKKRCTSECNKKKPICTCNMRIRLLLAGWLMPPRLRQAKPEKSWNAQRNFRNPKNANWQPKKEQCCFFHTLFLGNPRHGDGYSVLCGVFYESRMDDDKLTFQMTTQDKNQRQPWANGLGQRW